METAIQNTIAHLRTFLDHLHDVINLEESRSRYPQKEEAARNCAKSMPISPGLNLRDYWLNISGVDEESTYCTNLRAVEASIEKLINIDTSLFVFHLAGMGAGISDRFRRQLDETKEKLEEYRDTLYTLCELHKIRESIKAHISELGG